VTDVENGPANDAIVLDSGRLLPLVDACVLEIDLAARRILVARGFADAE
jgi:ribosomal 30S subunit maturation factor RimM